MNIKLLKSFLLYFPILFLLSCSEKPSERMVDIDGFKLFLKIKGEGKPTIIFENAMGGTSDFWDSIQATLSKITSVVTYDRAGNGKSEMSPFPRTNERMAQELHILLDKEEIDPPYILVASSYGAFISRTFSSLYPQEVAGMVLIEPVHEDLLPEMRKARTEEEWNQYIGIMDQMAENAPEGPKQEWSQYFNNSDAVRKIKLPDDISIILLTSTRFSEREKQMMYREDDIKKKYDLHKKWLNGKKNVKHLTTKKSGHNIAGREPELIIDSVIEILEKIKE